MKKYQVMSLQKEKYIYVYQNLSRLSLRLRIMTGLFSNDNFQNIQNGDCMMTFSLFTFISHKIN